MISLSSIPQLVVVVYSPPQFDICSVGPQFFFRLNFDTLRGASQLTTAVLREFLYQIIEPGIYVVIGYATVTFAGLGCYLTRATVC